LSCFLPSFLPTFIPSFLPSFQFFRRCRLVHRSLYECSLCAAAAVPRNANWDENSRCRY
jgi:hypothetical protein